MELMKEIKYASQNSSGTTNWIKCGVIFKKDNGKLKLKMDAIPINKNFDGWFEVLDPKPKSEL